MMLYPLIRNLLRAGMFLAALVLAAVVAGASVLLLPPTELLRRAVVTQLRAQLGLSGLDLGSLALRFRRVGTLEIGHIQVGAPEGYALPLLTAEAARLHYDLSQIGQRRLRISRLELVQPVVRIEQRDGRPNWQALLDQLAGTSAVDPSPGVEDKGAPSDASPTMEIEIERLAVEGLSAFVDQGSRRLVLDAVDLQGRLRLGPQESRGKLTLSIASRDEGGASLGLRVTHPEPVEATLDAGLRLEVELLRLRPLKVQGQLDLDLASRRIRSRWDVEPLHFELKAAARYDQRDDSARLEALSLRLNDHELVQASARLDAPQSEDARLALHLDQVALPLDLLAPYVRLFVPQLTCGGTVRLADVSLQGAVSRLGQRVPGMLGGRLELDDVWADLRAPAGKQSQVAFEGLSGQLHFGATDASGSDRPRAPTALLLSIPTALDSVGPVVSGPSRPAVETTVQLGVASLRVPGGRLEGLTLKAALAADLVDLDPHAAALRLRLRVPRIRYRDPSVGRVRGSVHLEASGHAAPKTGDATLERMRLLLNRQVRLDARAVVQGFGSRSLRARVKLAPLQLSTLWAQLPAALRAKLPLRKVGGRLAFRLQVSGRRPPLGVSLLGLPLRLDSRVELSNAGFDQLSEPGGNKVALRVRGLQAEVKLRGQAKDLQLDVDLHAQRLAHAAAGVALRGLSLPLSLRVKRQSVKGRFGLSVASLMRRGLDESIRQKDLALEGRARLELPVERVIATGAGPLGRAHVVLDGTVGSMRLRQPGLRLAVDGAGAHVVLEHEPGQADPLRWQLGLKLDKLHERIAGARSSDTAVSAQGRFRGVTPQLPETSVDLDALAGKVSLGLTVGELRHPSLSRQLQGARVDLALDLAPGGPLDLRQLELRAPTFGVALTATGRLFDPWRPLASAVGPTFTAALDLALDNPKTARVAQATALTNELRSAGKLGLSLKLTNLAGNDVLAKGRFVASGFHLWSSGTPQEIASSATRRRWRQSRFVLRNLDADVPLSQRLQLTLSPFGLTAPPPKRSILATTTPSTTYRLVRPFSRRRANLTLDGIELTDQLLEGPPAQRRVVSERELALGKSVLDLGYEDGTLELEQLYVKLFDGDLLGRLQVQLASQQALDVRLALAGRQALDVRLATDVQLTGVDLAYLDAAARRRGETAPISALARVKYEMARRYVAGRVLLTELSMKTLDKLLAYLDPHGIDESVQANRRLLGAWYTRAVRPKVERVSVEMDHSQLNLDIRLGALWPFGAILRRALSQVRIRRLSIKPFLPASADDDAKRPAAVTTARRAGSVQGSR